MISSFLEALRGDGGGGRGMGMGMEWQRRMSVAVEAVCGGGEKAILKQPRCHQLVVLPAVAHLQCGSCPRGVSWAGGGGGVRNGAGAFDCGKGRLRRHGLRVESLYRAEASVTG